jgi:hypothetical protein
VSHLETNVTSEMPAQKYFADRNTRPQKLWTLFVHEKDEKREG